MSNNNKEAKLKVNFIVNFPFGVLQLVSFLGEPVFDGLGGPFFLAYGNVGGGRFAALACPDDGRFTGCLFGGGTGAIVRTFTTLYSLLSISWFRSSAAFDSSSTVSSRVMRSSAWSLIMRSSPFVTFLMASAVSRGTVNTWFYLEYSTQSVREILVFFFHFFTFVTQKSLIFRFFTAKK